MFSRSSKYAIKGVLYLALHASVENKIQAKDLSAPINAPAPYIAKLLQELARHNMVSSVKGPHGGFYLDEVNLQMNIMQIIEIIDGEDKFRSCLLSLEQCNSENPCPLHNLVGDQKLGVIHNLENTTIKELVADVKQGNSILPL
ncbi:RrF2 family transcriptional regulator [Flagellimonas meishanensis]|uniref:RrF2 family transcriptional regulator n=1 Tax=Flagellimonas meishanensis TaxID=2873264 RepID=UPI001CA77585|nr:Rrf2 family transcriptional regulator [[Muricauda] meishanensis]